jgi:7-cyano-7-deazaguanine tRNA-ribosyltransferase
MRRVKQAVRRGDLLGLVDARARGHPAMLDGYRALLDHADQLERTDPAGKDAFFHVSAESSRRPEVLRHHERLKRLPVSPGTDLLLSEGERNDEYDETWRLAAPFGPYPRDLSDSYPLTAELPERRSPEAYEAAAAGVRALVEANPEVSVTVAHWLWPEGALASLPDSVTVRSLGE